MSIRIAAIAAMDEARVIGFEGKLPWRIPEDLRRFAALTTGNTVLMGRKTYESLPEKFKPLPNRLNVVVSRTRTISHPGVLVVSDPDEFLKQCRSDKVSIQGDTVWVIGGGEIYTATLPFWGEIELTLVKGNHVGDAYFPNFEDRFTLESDEPFNGFSFQRWVKNKI